MNLNKLILFKTDKRIFTLFCALHSTRASYFKRISDKKLSLVGKEVRAFLLKKKFKTTYKLKNYFNKYFPYYFITWVLQYSVPPQFKKLYRKWKGELSLNYYRGFDKLVREFYFEANIFQLWKEYRGEYLKESDKYRDIVSLYIQEILNYLKIKKLPFKKVIFIPNLLDAIGAGYGATIYDRAYVIFGPSKRKLNIRLLHHEFLHNIINPLIQENRINKRVIKENKHLLRKIISPILLKYYDNSEIIAIEYIIRTIELRLFSTKKRVQYIRDQIKRGFPYIEFFDNQLKEYEKSNETFVNYLAIILKNLKYLKINKKKN
jgi:hypothetical protein